MKRRDFLKTAGGVAAGIAIECDSRAEASRPEHPNLLIVFPD